MWTHVCHATKKAAIHMHMYTPGALHHATLRTPALRMPPMLTSDQTRWSLMLRPARLHSATSPTPVLTAFRSTASSTAPTLTLKPTAPAPLVVIYSSFCSIGSTSSRCPWEHTKQTNKQTPMQGPSLCKKTDRKCFPPTSTILCSEKFQTAPEPQTPVLFVFAPKAYKKPNALRFRSRGDRHCS